MLQFITGLPSHVVGIHAVGEVTKQDVERVLMPKIEELVQRQGEINYLLVLETGIQNFTLGAVWVNDVKIGLKNFTKWNKIAVVSDQKVVEWFSDIFRFFIPGNSKGFPLAELDEAVKWISAQDENETKNQIQKPMTTDNNVQNPKNKKDVADNNNASPKNDVTGENAGSAAEKGKGPNVQDKPDSPRVKTVVPDNDSGNPGPSTENSSNVNQGPAGENL